MTVTVGAGDLPVLDLERHVHARRQDERPERASSSASSSAPTSPATSPACASTRAPATPARTSATCGRAGGTLLGRGDLHRRDRLRLAAGRPSPTPVAITANTTYVASYHTPIGHYAATAATSHQRRRQPAAARAADGVDGPNGVYTVRRRAALPDRHLQRDQLLGRRRLRRRSAPDTTPPTSRRVAGRRRHRRRRHGQRHRDLQRADGPGHDQRAQRSSCATRRTRSSRRPSPTTPRRARATLDPTAPSQSRPPTPRRSRAASGVTDARRQRARRRLDLVVHHRGAAAAAARRGPGRPDPGRSRTPRNPFSRYYAEILRAEGLNEFTVTDISDVTPAILDAYDVAILGEMAAERRPGEDAQRLGARRAAT